MGEEERRALLYKMASEQFELQSKSFDDLDSSKQQELYKMLKEDSPDLAPEKDFAEFQQKYFAEYNADPSKSKRKKLYKQVSEQFELQSKSFDDLDSSKQQELYKMLKEDSPDLAPEKDFAEFQQKYFGSASKKKVGGGVSETGLPKKSDQPSKELADKFFAKNEPIFDPNTQDYTPAYKQEYYSKVTVPQQLKQEQELQKQKQLLEERKSNGTLDKDIAAAVEQDLTKSTRAEQEKAGMVLPITDLAKIQENADKIVKPKEMEQRAKQVVDNFIQEKKQSYGWQKGTDFALQQADMDALNAKIQADPELTEPAKKVILDYAKAQVAQRDDINSFVDEFFTNSQRSKVPSNLLSQESRGLFDRAMKGEKISPQQLAQMNKEQDEIIKQAIIKTDGTLAELQMNEQELTDLKNKINEKYPNLTVAETQQINSYIRQVANKKNQDIYKANRVETEIKALDLPDYGKIAQAQKEISAELEAKFTNEIASFSKQNTATLSGYKSAYENEAKVLQENTQKAIATEQQKAQQSMAALQDLIAQGKITPDLAEAQRKQIEGNFNNAQQQILQSSKTQADAIYKNYTAQSSKAQVDALKAQQDYLANLSKDSEQQYAEMLKKRGISPEKIEKLSLLQKQLDIEDKVLNTVIAHRKWESQSFFENAAETLQRGLNNVTLPLNDLAMYLNPTSVSDFVAGTVRQQEANQLGARNFGEFSWDKMLSLDYITTKAVEQAPQFLMFRGLGKIGMSAGTMAARAAGTVAPIMTNPTVQRALAMSVGAGSMRVAEGQMIAASLHKNLIDQGFSVDYANNKASEVFYQSLPLIAMDALELYNSYGKTSVFNIAKRQAARKGGLAAAGLSTATSFGQEGFDELYQGMLEYNAMNPLNVMNLGQFAISKEGQEAFALGGLTSGLTSIAGSASKFLNSRDASARGTLLGNNRYSIQDQVERLNENLEKYFSDMTAEEISPDALNGRLFQLQASLETLRERGLIDEKEWATATQQINVQKSIYDQYNQGLLGNMELNGSQMQQYAVKLSELSMVNAQIAANGQGDKNSGDNVNSTALNNRRSELQSEINELIKQSKPVLYRISENGDYKDFADEAEFKAALSINEGRLKNGEVSYYTSDEKLNEEIEKTYERPATDPYAVAIPNENLELAQNYVDVAVPLYRMDILGKQIKEDEKLTTAEKAKKTADLVKETKDKQGKGADGTVTPEYLNQLQTEVEQEIALLSKSLTAKNPQEVLAAAKEIQQLRQDIAEGNTIDFLPNSWGNKALRIAKLMKMKNGFSQMADMLKPAKQEKTLDAAEQAMLEQPVAADQQSDELPNLTEEQKQKARSLELEITNPEALQQPEKQEQQKVEAPQEEVQQDAQAEAEQPQETEQQIEVETPTNEKVAEAKTSLFGDTEEKQQSYAKVAEQMSDEDFLAVGQIQDKIASLREQGTLTPEAIAENENIVSNVQKTFFAEIDKVFGKIDTTNFSGEEKLLFNILQKDTKAKISTSLDPTGVLAKINQRREQEKKDQEAKAKAAKERADELNAQIAAINAKTQAEEAGKIAAYREKHKSRIAEFVKNVKSGRTLESAKKEFNQSPTKVGPLVPVELLDAVLSEAYAELAQYALDEKKAAEEKIALGGEQQQAVFETEKQAGNLLAKTSETIDATSKEIELIETEQGKKTPEQLKKETGSGERVRVVVEKGAKIAKRFFRQAAAAIKKISGAVTDVYFSKKTNVKNPKARYTLMELNQVQASDKFQGNALVPNPLFFLNEGQPKQRGELDAATILSSTKDFNPLLVTEGTIAFSGAPVVNERGESIQGTGRIARIQAYYKTYADGAAYKSYLLKNAARFGLNPADVMQFKQPVLVRMVGNISDGEAVKFGNFTVADMEDKGKPFMEALSAINRNKFDAQGNLTNSYKSAQQLFVNLIQEFQSQKDTKFSTFFTEKADVENGFLRIAQLLDKDGAFITAQDAANISAGNSVDSIEKLKQFFRYAFYSHSAQSVSEILDSNLIMTLPTVDGAKGRSAIINFDDSGILQLLAFTQSNNSNKNKEYSPIQPIIADSIITLKSFFKSLAASPLKISDIQQTLVNGKVQNQGVQALQDRFNEWIGGGMFEGAEKIPLHPIAKEFISMMLTVAGTAYYPSVKNKEIEKTRLNFDTAVRKFAIELVENLNNNQNQAQQDMFAATVIKSDAAVFLDTINQFVNSNYQNEKDGEKGYHSFNPAGTPTKERKANFFSKDNPFYTPQQIGDILNQANAYEQTDEQRQERIETVARRPAIAAQSTDATENANLPIQNEQAQADISPTAETTGAVDETGRVESQARETLASGDETAIDKQAIIVQENADNLPVENAHALTLQNTTELAKDGTLSDGEAVRINEVSADTAKEKIASDPNLAANEIVTQQALIDSDTAITNAIILDEKGNTEEGGITLDEAIDAIKQIMADNTNKTPAKEVVTDITDVEILKNKNFFQSELSKDFPAEAVKGIIDDALAYTKGETTSETAKVHYSILNSLYKNRKPTKTKANVAAPKEKTTEVQKEKTATKSQPSTAKKKSAAEKKAETMKDLSKMLKDLGGKLGAGFDPIAFTKVVVQIGKLAYYSVAEIIENYNNNPQLSAIAQLKKAREQGKSDFLALIKESNLDAQNSTFKGINWAKYYDEQWEKSLSSDTLKEIKELDYASPEIKAQIKSQSFASLQDFVDKLSALQAEYELNYEAQENKTARVERIKLGAESRARLAPNTTQKAPIQAERTQIIPNDPIPKPNIQYTKPQSGALPEGLMYVKPEYYDQQIDEHQQYAVNLALTAFFKNKQKAFLMADNMGVGKTRQMLVIASEYRAKTGKKVLVVSQSETIWKNAFMKDAEALGINLDDFEFSTYDSLKSAPREVGLVIFDESQNLKNPSLAFDVKNAIKYDNALYASATPADKVGGFLYFLPDLVGKTTDELAFELGVKRGTKRNDTEEWQSDGRVPYAKQVEIINGYIQKALENGQMVRREYPFWGEEVPVTVQITEEQRREIAKIETIFASRIKFVRPTSVGFRDPLTGKFYSKIGGWRSISGLAEKYKGKTAAEMDEIDNQFIRELNERRIAYIDKVTETWKAKYIAEQIAIDLANGKSVVVASQYVNELQILDTEAIISQFQNPEAQSGQTSKDITKKSPSFLQILQSELEARGVKFNTITGDYATKEKAKMINEFTNSTQPQVIIGSLTSMSAGISLDAQSENSPQRVMYIASPSYAADEFEQIQGRISRKSSKRSAEIRLVIADTTQDQARKNKVIAKSELLAVSQGQGISPALRKEMSSKEQRANDNPIVEERARTKTVVMPAPAPKGTYSVDIGNKGDAQGLVFGKNNEMVLIQVANPSPELLAKLNELGATQGEARDNAGNFIGNGWIVPLATLKKANTKLASDLGKLLNLAAQKVEAAASLITVRKDTNAIRVFSAENLLGNTLMAMGATKTEEQGKTVYRFDFSAETIANYPDIAKRVDMLTNAANNYLIGLKETTKAQKDVSAEAFVQTNTKSKASAKVWVVKGLNPESRAKITSLTSVSTKQESNGTHTITIDESIKDANTIASLANAINAIIAEQNKQSLATTKQSEDERRKAGTLLQTQKKATTGGAIGAGTNLDETGKAIIIDGEIIQTEQEKAKQQFEQGLSKAVVEFDRNLATMNFAQALSQVPIEMRASVMDSVGVERVALAQDFTPSQPPRAKRATEIIQGVLDYTKKITVRFGKKMSKYTLGQYSFGLSEIKLRKTGDIDTFMHELGHALDDMLQLYTDDAAIKSELQLLAIFGSTAPKSATEEQRNAYELREGIAEFIRGYMVNPEAMKIKAPNFYNRLLVKSATFKNMTDGAVDIMELLDQAGNDIRILYSVGQTSGVQATANKMIDPSEFDKKQTIWKKVRNWAQGNNYIYGKKPNIKQQIWALTTDFWEQSIVPMGLMLFGTKAGRADNFAEKILQIIEGDDSKNPLLAQLKSPTKRFSTLYRLNFSIHGKINEYLQNGMEDFSKRKELEEMQYTPTGKTEMEKGATLVYRAILADAKKKAAENKTEARAEFEAIITNENYTDYQKLTMMHLFDNPSSSSIAVARVFDNNGRTINLAYLFEPIGNLAGEVKDEQVWQKELGAAATYMILQRSLELAERFVRDNANLPNPPAVPVSILPYQLDNYNNVNVIERLKDDIRSFESQAGGKLAYYQTAAERYRFFANSVLQYMLSKGRITQKQYNDITKNNTQYVSFARIYQATMQGGSDSLLNMDFSEGVGSYAPLKTINKDGSFADFANNPYSNLLETVYRNVMEADRNEVVRSFVDTFFAAFDMNLARAQNVTADNEIQKQEFDLSNSIMPMYAENMTEEQRNSPAIQDKENILVYYDKAGEKKYLQFNDRDLYQSVKSLGKISSRFESIANPIVRGALKIFAALGRVTRAMYVLSLGAVINNFKRDDEMRFLNSRTHGNAVEQLWDFVKMELAKFNPFPLLSQFLPENVQGKLPSWVVNNKKEIEAKMNDLARTGGDQSKFYLANIEDGYNMDALSAIKMLISQQPNGKKLMPFSMPTAKGAFNFIKNKYSFYIDKLENASRIKEFDRAYNYAVKDLGMTDFEAQNYAAFQARDLMDYAQMSEFMYVFNQLYFFSNASLRGVLRTFGDWKHKPVEKLMRLGMISAFNLMPALLFLSMGEDEYEAYEAQAGYKKHFFLLLPTPWGGSEYVHLPLPHETAVLTTLPQRILALVMGKKTALDDLGSSVARSTFGLFGKDLVPSLFQPIRDVMNNYSEFRKKPIVYNAQLDLSLQDKRAAALSRLIAAPFGTNPKYTDYLIEGYAGSWGKMLLDASDFIVGDSRQRGTALDIQSTPNWLDFMIDQVGIVKEKTVFSIKPLNDNFETAKLFNMQKHPRMQELKSLSEKYRELKTKGSEEKAQELYFEIVKKSISLRESWNTSAAEYAAWMAQNPDASSVELVKAKNRLFGQIE